MKGKIIIPVALLALGALSGCGGSNQPVTITIDNPHSGLGYVDVSHLGGNSYELTVMPIGGITLGEVKVNDEVVTLTNATHAFIAKPGENTISVDFEEPEAITQDLSCSILANNILFKSVNAFNYVYRSMYLNYESLEVDTNIFRMYDTTLYANGTYADVVLGTANDTKLYSDDEFAYTTETEGFLTSYKVDEKSYMRAMIPESFHEDGFAEVLERNYYYDETSEDLGYNDYAYQVLLNFTGAEPNFPESYGYTNAWSVTETEESIIATHNASCEMYTDDWGWTYPTEDHSYDVVMDKASYEITDIYYHGVIYQSDESSPVVTVMETVYEDITYGEYVNFEFTPVSNFDTIDPDYVSVTAPTIQADIADGELTKEDAVKILDNIWAYAENTRTSTATGAAYMYDADYNEIPGMSTMTTTAYKDYFLVTENIFVPDDKETYGEQVIAITQKSAKPEGICNVGAVDGVVDPDSCWYDYVGPTYNMAKNFSASPLMQDMTVGFCVNEAVQYGLTTEIEESEWGVYGLIYDDFSATKDGEDITIKWSVCNYYGEDDPQEATFYQIVIVDNFVKNISYGPSFEDCLTYTMTQGEYEEYTGVVYEYVEPEY